MVRRRVCRSQKRAKSDARDKADGALCASLLLWSVSLTDAVELIWSLLAALADSKLAAAATPARSVAIVCLPKSPSATKMGPNGGNHSQSGTKLSTCLSGD